MTGPGNGGGPPPYRGEDPPPYAGFPTEASQRIYDSRWCGLRRDIIRLDSGALQDYHVFEVPEAVVVVPVLEDGSLLLVWQYRHPHGETHWEMPAGRMHPGESPVDAAHRELSEESGHEATDLELLQSFYPINGISDHLAHAFVARGCRRVGDLRLDPAEKLEVHVFRPEQARELLLAGAIRDGFTALALHAWLARSE